MTRTLAALAVAFLLPPVLILLLVVGGSASCTAGQVPRATAHLDADQTRNASTVVAVGRGLGAPSRGLVVALATALQESGLRNLVYGDRDSLGLFQQRPSQGWGSPAQIVDPRYAASRFYAALLAVPGWRALSVAAAAQAVQRSAFPDAYARWEDDATVIVAALTGSGMDAGRATGCASAASLPAGAVSGMLEFAAAQVGDAYVLGANGPDAWDCSSLLRAAVATVGVDLPRTAAQQYDWFRTRGRLLPGPAQLSWLRSGDVLFSLGANPNPAGDREPVGHVALYAGQGVVVEAKGHASGVTSGRYSDTALASVTWVGRLIADDNATGSPARVFAGSRALDPIFSERRPS